MRTLLTSLGLVAVLQAAFAEGPVVQTVDVATDEAEWDKGTDLNDAKSK